MMVLKINICERYYVQKKQKKEYKLFLILYVILMIFISSTHSKCWYSLFNPRKRMGFADQRASVYSMQANRSVDLTSPR